MVLFRSVKKILEWVITKNMVFTKWGANLDEKKLKKMDKKIFSNVIQRIIKIIGKKHSRDSLHTFCIVRGGGGAYPYMSKQRAAARECI